MFTDEKTLMVATLKNPKDQLYARTATKREDVATRCCAHDQSSDSHVIRQQITSGWKCTSLMLVDHEVKINERYYCNMMLLQQFLPTICQIAIHRTPMSDLNW